MIKQGEIYLADLNPIQGHEQGGTRPVIILQNNILNRHMNTAIIAPITSNTNLKGRLTTQFLSKKTSKLHKDSVVLLHQIRCIDPKRLKHRIHKVSKKELSLILEQLQFVF